MECFTLMMATRLVSNAQNDVKLLIEFSYIIFAFFVDPLQNSLYFMAHLSASEGRISMSVHHDDYSGMANKVLDTIRLLGVNRAPAEIKVNGVSHEKFSVKPTGEVFIQELRLPANQDFVVEFI